MSPIRSESYPNLPYRDHIEQDLGMVNKASKIPTLSPIPEEELTLEVKIVIPYEGSTEKPSVKHPGGGINYVW